MIEKISINEFRESGFLWFVNRMLHAFGLVLVVEDDKIYPARTSLRGFPLKSEENGYKNVAKYLNENSEKILNEEV